MVADLPPTLGRRTSFWVAASVVAHTLWTSAAPAMTYPLYASEWNLTTTTTTAIFSIYPVVVVAVLICFGDLSDFIGRRATMLMGLAASLAGILLFAVAPNVATIFVGRILMGIGVGLSASPSTAAMLEFSAKGQSHRASSIATAAQAIGFGSATLIGGAFIQYAPFPTRLNFWALFIVVSFIFCAVWFLPRHTAGETTGRWRPRSVSVPRGIRAIFATSATSVTTAYVLGGMMLSLGAHIARDVIGSSNTLVNGAAITLFALIWAIVGIAAKKMPSRPAMMLGSIASVTAMALLMIASDRHTLPIFLGASAVAGIAYSLMFLGGLGLINRNAPAHHRGATLSAMFLIAYLMQGLVAFGLGAAATAGGLDFAINWGAGIITVMSVAAILLTLFAGGGAARPPLATNP